MNWKAIYAAKHQAIVLRIDKLQKALDSHRAQVERNEADGLDASKVARVAEHLDRALEALT